MKKKNYYFLLAFLFLFVAQFSSFAQEEEESDEFGDFDVTNPMDQQSSLGALLGYTDIGGEKCIGMRIKPELALGKLGFGIDLPLMFNLDDGSFRTDEFNSGVGVFRLIRYVRWGVKKRDPLFVRVGDLTGTWIGYGMLVDNYTNSIAFEKRKVGVSFDVLVKNVVGVEGMYSDFDAISRNLLAIRPYVRPLGNTKIPIFKTTEIGFTHVSDKDQTFIESDSLKHQTNTFLNEGMSAWALDIGVIPISRSFMQLKIYAQYGNLAKNKSQVLADSLEALAVLADPTDADKAARYRGYDGGSGFGIGADFKFKFAGNVLRLDARLERLWYQNNFMPQFFDATYEINKDARFLTLANTESKKGIYGALSATALEKVMVGGTLMIPDNVSETAPATLSLHMDASRLFEKFVITGQYIKGDLTDLSDAFKLDERSLLTTRVAYKVYKFFLVGMDYNWTWAPVEQADGTYKYSATHYASPYFGVNFNFGQKKDRVIGIEDDEDL